MTTAPLPPTIEVKAAASQVWLRVTLADPATTSLRTDDGSYGLIVPSATFPFLAPGDMILATVALTRIAAPEPVGTERASGLIIPGKQAH